MRTPVSLKPSWGGVEGDLGSFKGPGGGLGVVLGGLGATKAGDMAEFLLNAGEMWPLGLSF